MKLYNYHHIYNLFYWNILVISKFEFINYILENKMLTIFDYSIKSLCLISEVII